MEIHITHSSSRPVRFLIPVYSFMKFAAQCPSDRCEVLAVVIPYDILNRRGLLVVINGKH